MPWARERKGWRSGAALVDLGSPAPASPTISPRKTVIMRSPTSGLSPALSASIIGSPDSLLSDRRAPGARVISGSIGTLSAHAEGDGLVLTDELTFEMLGAIGEARDSPYQTMSGGLEIGGCMSADVSGPKGLLELEGQGYKLPAYATLRRAAVRRLSAFPKGSATIISELQPPCRGRQFR